MSIQIYDWDEMTALSLEKKNGLLYKLITKKDLTEKELEFLDQLQEHLENEFWECQYCHIYFLRDAKDLRYNPERCDSCIEEDVTVFGISYDKADPETKKWMNDVIQKERQIDMGHSYYGL